MRALAGEVGWNDPEWNPPPRGVKLLILTSGGVAVLGDWRDDSNFVAWSPLPKRPGPPTVSDTPSETHS
jgi:hypothetical protein